MIDSHAHIEMCEGTTAEVVHEASINGINRILTIGLTGASFDTTLEIAEQHESVFAAVGWHPNESTGFGPDQAAAIVKAAQHQRVVAIGETGLDFYRESTPPGDQERAFRAQIAIAQSVGLPVVIHARAAERRVLDVLEEDGGDVAVILHCFSATEQIDEVIERGYYCSFAGNVTYKNAGDLRDACAKVPDELLLVETDAPFLAPQPIRGKRNQPANVTMTAEVVAELRGIRYDELSTLVETNAQRVFGW